MGLLSLLLGCGRSSPPTLQNIAEGGEEGWHDLALTVTSYTTRPDGTQSIDLAGIHQGTRVALRAILSKEWKERPADDQLPMTTYRGTVAFLSLGSESDLFLSVLHALYGTNVRPKAMKKETLFTGISLGGDPRHPDKGDVRIKLFYEPDDQNLYAELYFNILLAKKIVQIHEKDPEYRENVVRALAQ